MPPGDRGRYDGPTSGSGPSLSIAPRRRSLHCLAVCSPQGLGPLNSLQALSGTVWRSKIGDFGRFRAFCRFSAAAARIYAVAVRGIHIGDWGSATGYPGRCGEIPQDPLRSRHSLLNPVVLHPANDVIDRGIMTIASHGD